MSWLQSFDTSNPAFLTIEEQQLLFLGQDDRGSFCHCDREELAESFCTSFPRVLNQGVYNKSSEEVLFR